MNQFLVLRKVTDNALALLSIHSLDIIEFGAMGYTQAFAGSKQECMEWIKEFWDEEHIPEDRQILFNDISK